MPKRLNDLAPEVLKLDATARATLARKRIESLEHLMPEEFDELWADEAEERCAAFLRGEMQAEDGDEVFERARNRTL